MTSFQSVNRFSRKQQERSGSPHTSVTQIRRAWLIASATALLISSAAASPALETRKSGIDSVSTSKPFFNPSLNQSVRISFSVSPGGHLSVVVLDRDGFPVRTLASRQPVEAGNVGFDWDGKNDSGRVVANEAYSLKIDLVTTAGSYTYFPANGPAVEVGAVPGYYDRATATFAYRLEAAARVHIQAGLGQFDRQTGKSSGPVLKTLVNRGPRPAGAVVETWNGLDETGSYYVPDLDDFVMAIAATSLPENCMMTIGQEKPSFLEQAQARRGVSLLTYSAVNHLHHSALSALDDVSPTLRALASNASPDSPDSPDSPASIGKLWRVDGSSLKGKLVLEGPSSAAFAKQPAAVSVFIDSRRVQTKLDPTTGMLFEVPLTGLRPGPHIVAFDWASEYGPVAVTSMRVRVAGPGEPAPVSGR